MTLMQFCCISFSRMQTHWIASGWDRKVWMSIISELPTQKS